MWNIWLKRTKEGSVSLVRAPWIALQSTQVKHVFQSISWLFNAFNSRHIEDAHDYHRIPRRLAVDWILFHLHLKSVRFPSMVDSWCFYYVCCKSYLLCNLQIHAAFENSGIHKIHSSIFSLVLKYKFSETMSRFCANLPALGWTRGGKTLVNDSVNVKQVCPYS